MVFGVSSNQTRIKTKVLLCTALAVVVAFALAGAPSTNVPVLEPQKAHAATVDSATGKWMSSSGKWWYAYSAATKIATGKQYPSNDWVKISGKMYYFDSKGWMNTGWAKISNKWYWFGSDGAMKTGWQAIGGTWYFLDKSTGAMKTGWLVDGKSKYYLDGSGAMATGWNQVGSNWYYHNGSGVMQTGWVYSGGAWYYLNPSNGVMKTGWNQVGKTKYYHDASGAMQTGWVKSGGAWYYLNSSGVMATNQWIDKTYWVGSDGKMATNAWVDGGKYYVGKDGVWNGKPARNTGGTTGSTGSGSSGSAGGGSGSQVAPQNQTQYTYELQVLNQHGLYTNNDIVLYVKTNNPNPKGFYIGTPTRPLVSMHLPYFDDVRLKDTGDERWEKQPLASGTGFIAAVQVDQAGTHDLIVYEYQYQNGNYYRSIKTGTLTTINVLDYATEEAKWIDSMIAQYTTSDMTPVQKMNALCEAFSSRSGNKSLFRYNPVIYRNGNTNWEYARLVSEKGPYFKTYHWDSYESPAVLCKFAERIGGFENIRSCFSDYDMGTPGWYKWHWFCKATYQGKEYAFEACPMPSTFVVNKINYLDL